MSIQALRDDVAALATADGRMVGTPGHAAAREFLVDRLGRLRLSPCGADFVLPYSSGGCDFFNIVAKVEGRSPRVAPVLVAAHYDTCGALPGADDNAAAVAIVLALAERIQADPLDRGLVVALFDAEEPPHYLSSTMGSIHWYAHQRQGPVHCAVALDLVGHDVPVPGLEDLLFVTGMESDPRLPIEIGHRRVRAHPVLNQYVGDLSDHHVFRVHERPFLFLSCGRWEHYHAATDTPDRLNYEKMAGVLDVTEQLVRHAAAQDLAGPFGAGETLGLECEAIRAHFGGLLDGAADIESRRDVDEFIQAAMAAYAL